MSTHDSKSPADTEVSEQEGRRCSWGWSWHSPAAPGADQGEAAVPLQPVWFHSRAEIHLQHMEDPTLENINVPEGDSDPVGNLCWSRLLAGPVKRGAQTGAALLAGLVTPQETHCRAP